MPSGLWRKGAPWTRGADEEAALNPQLHCWYWSLRKTMVRGPAGCRLWLWLGRGGAELCFSPGDPLGSWWGASAAWPQDP